MSKIRYSQDNDEKWSAFDNKIWVFNYDTKKEAKQGIKKARKQKKEMIKLEKMLIKEVKHDK